MSKSAFCTKTTVLSSIYSRIGADFTQSIGQIWPNYVYFSNLLIYRYIESGINLEFLQAELVPYEQHIGHFESALSIIDVMMFNSKEEIQKMLNQYQLI